MTLPTDGALPNWQIYWNWKIFPFCSITIWWKCHATLENVNLESFTFPRVGHFFPPQSPPCCIWSFPIKFLPVVRGSPGIILYGSILKITTNWRSLGAILKWCLYSFWNSQFAPKVFWKRFRELPSVVGSSPAGGQHLNFLYIFTKTWVHGAWVEWPHCMTTSPMLWFYSCWRGTNHHSVILSDQLSVELVPLEHILADYILGI